MELFEFLKKVVGVLERLEIPYLVTGALAEMAGRFANDFGAGDWGYVAGLWHDIGKYTIEFQEMLTTKLMKSRILHEIHCTT